MVRRMVVRITVAVAAILVVVAGWLWFFPSGTGEFRHSPDGRFTAHATNMTTGTITGGRDRYIKIRVVEDSSGREVWRIVQGHTAEADVPDYGTRGKRFIAWAPDSSSVTVPVADGRELALPVR